MMSKEFEEAKLRISADVVYDPDLINDSFYSEMHKDIKRVLSEYRMLHKNIDIELEGFTCEQK